MVNFFVITIFDEKNAKAIKPEPIIKDITIQITIAKTMITNTYKIPIKP